MTYIQDTKRQAAVEYLRKMLHDIPVALLTTVSPDGSLHARPMVNVNDKFNDALWLFTRHGDPKSQEIEANSQFNVAFSAPSQYTCACATGRAENLRDSKQ